jgi:hypothetical protein
MQVWSEPCGDKTRALVCFGLAEIWTQPFGKVCELEWQHPTTLTICQVPAPEDARSGEDSGKQKRDIFKTLLTLPRSQGTLPGGG